MNRLKLFSMQKFHAIIINLCKHYLYSFIIIPILSSVLPLHRICGDTEAVIFLIFLIVSFCSYCFHSMVFSVSLMNVFYQKRNHQG